MACRERGPHVARAESNGGSAWESNPAPPRERGATDFEDREGHRAPFASEWIAGADLEAFAASARRAHDTPLWPDRSQACHRERVVCESVGATRGSFVSGYRAGGAAGSRFTTRERPTRPAPSRIGAGVMAGA
jgi:hypothetical protein